MCRMDAEFLAFMAGGPFRFYYLYCKPRRNIHVIVMRSKEERTSRVLHTIPEFEAVLGHVAARGGIVCSKTSTLDSIYKYGRKEY